MNLSIIIQALGLLVLVFLGLGWIFYKAIKKYNIQKSVSHNAHPFRELTSDERLYFDNKIISYKKNIFPFIISLVLSCMLFILILLISSNIPFLLLIVLSLFLAVSILVCGLCIVSFFSTLNYKKDLKEKVYKVEGKIFKERVATGRYWGYLITVGHVEFPFGYYDKELVVFYNKSKQAADVIVEYSPHSKHIWKIDFA